ncbi:MAG: CRTAC1 family protein [Woeseiaceae bacterium]|nr:CRTAC1 family protein [Woeseiaceae bacterium]
MKNDARCHGRLCLVPLLALGLTACSCGGGGGNGNSVRPPPPAPPPSASCTTPIEPGGAFTQTTPDLGLCYEVDEIIAPDGIHVMGGGLAMSDVDQDGFPDLFVVHGIDQKGQLFMGGADGFSPAPGNNGIDLRGLDNAGYFVDLDGDGWDDFVSIQYSTNFVEIFINDGTGNFAEATASTGIFMRKPTYSMAAGDYDLDGDLDLFFAHWGWFWRENDPVTEYLWENDGNGFFTDVSDIVEILPTYQPPPIDDVPIEHSFTPIFADINSDGWPDMLLAGDYESTQVLINDAGNAFIDATTAVISDENGMGAAVADYDNDGDLDWFVSSIHFRGREEDKQYVGGITGNRLYQNDGTGVFTDVTDAAGVREGDWGWGACFADFDNDGHADILHTNGMRSVNSIDGNPDDPLFLFFDDPTRLFMAQGDGTFVESAAALGINHVDQGRGVLCTDYDADGRIDVLISTNGESPTVYRNQITNGNHYLQIDLEGPPGNRRGVGARVTVETAAATQVQEVILGSNYLSQQPVTLHFGLAGETIVTSVTVDWPGDQHGATIIGNVAADQRLTIALP